jgi:hypothetical protein
VQSNLEGPTVPSEEQRLYANTKFLKKRGETHCTFDWVQNIPKITCSILTVLIDLATVDHKFQGMSKSLLIVSFIDGIATFK